jgi:hypothetical protein
MTLLKQAVLLSCLLALGGVVAAFAAHPLQVDRYAHGLLWKIEAEGRAPPSYLCGTIHLADPGATNLPPPAPPLASINCSTACSRNTTAVCSNTCCPACRQATPSSPSGPDTSVPNTACCACSNGTAGA